MKISAPVDEKLRLKINQLKKKLDAIIVAHNYQNVEVQEVADITGDSLELAREATKLKAEVLVLCGVRFMAETAAILNPARTVLLAEEEAGCPMADMISVEDLKIWKQRYPKATVVCYINSSAEIKAASDYCCTSANAIQIVQAVPNCEILFIPDKNLGHYVSTKTDKRIVLYPGYCHVHHRLTREHVIKAREKHPGGVVLVHPECRAEVIACADAALSTSQMLQYARESRASTFLIGTERGLLYRLQKDNPTKEFYVISESLTCPDMKRTTLQSVVRTMELCRNVVSVSEETRIKAKQALDRMLSVT